MFARNLLWLLALTPYPASVPRPALRPVLHAFVFQHDGILGTSLDLTFVTASPTEAEVAEHVALAEIERLRRIISTWDRSSEVSRLVASGHAPHASADLIAVLNQYGAWQQRTGNAYSARVAMLAGLWREAQQQNRLPDSAALAAVVRSIQSPAWRIDGTAVTMLAPTPIDLNSLGKGYIIDRVVQLVRERVPGVRGGLVNIGGDVRAWGEAAHAGGSTWRVAIADPRDHADNAAPLSELHVADRAVSSSGNYERGFDINGQHWSHIIDPRTGYPADSHAGVTVIANDNATANALATAISVLSAGDALRLVAATPGAEALIVTSKGTTIRTPGFAAFESPRPSPAAPAAPSLIQGSVVFDVTPKESNRHRPYVAVWITDTANKHIRTLAFWGSKPKYQREMSKWWGQFGTETDIVDAVTRATRPTGKYTLDWDGLNQAGAAVPAGPYRFWLEAAFEDGAHSVKSVVVNCGGSTATGALDAAAAFAGGLVECMQAGK